MESSSLRKSPYYMNREKRESENFVWRVISPAIQGQKCPICLESLCYRRTAVLTDCTHAYCLECINKWSNLKRHCPLCNAPFDSWFYKIDLSSSKFLRQQLPALRGDKSVILQSQSSSRAPHRIIGRLRDESDGERCPTRPLPWRRSFGRQGSVPDEIVAERKLQWRASVYNKCLQAVPLSPTPRSFLGQHASGNNYLLGRLLQRIEPWIGRELQAILGDPDPSIIVHVASSLFIACLERKLNAPPRQPCVADDFLAPLRPFLHNHTDMFWHELRCFAESSLTMETYDSVVEYRKLD
ncbi:E3 ubiquitin-protein ligase Topors [Melia azedarach]|uniref:E3 ubiquitin-protein ligase Topors n=2 Tax=Melia azedarach TaxID=155640 RepID=A0ACC1YEL1_MELAZ|nr:E3 ubiquitin-protein ligase Topors [Melia azedarach]KAJ4722226.1 E3 ubiquitin-protein ligase Topors [Melia azedarach]